MSAPVPNLFLIGAPKCGTTSIAAYLDRHPEVYVPAIKELEYFADDGRTRVFADRGAYLANYREAAPAHRWRLDASASYLYSPTAVANIMAFDPAARILAIVRDPMEMVPSLHHELCLTRLEDCLSLDEAWARIPRRKAGLDIPAASRHPEGLYYDEVAFFGAQVRRLLDLVPRGQVHLMVFDDLRAQPAAVFAGLCAFLGIAEVAPAGLAAANRRREWRVPWLGDLILSAPAQWLKRTLGLRRDSAVSRLFLRPAGGGGPSPEIRQAIRACYRDDVALLETLLERPLGHWLRVER